MNNLNSILLEGNLYRDPELRYTPSDGTTPGTPLCTLVVASVCAEHLAKGRGVRVVGRIKQKRWEDSARATRARRC